MVAATAHELGPQFEVAGIDLRVDVEPVEVAGDPHRLHQVTSNLLNNALKFSSAGSPVSVTVRREDGVARLVVGDEGVGIPADSSNTCWTASGEAGGHRGSPGAGSG